MLRGCSLTWKSSSGVMMVKGHQESNRNNASKSIGSIVKIDSISIDLDNVLEKSNVGKCKHFSMRGYVSEIRKKNWKLCWPFDLDEEDNKLEEQKTILPSLHVPKFRRWCCQNCVNEIGFGGTVKDYGSKFNSFVGSKSNSSSLLGDAAIFQSDLQQPLKLNVAEGINVDAYTSTKANCNLQNPFFCEKREEKAAEVGPFTFKGNKSSLKDRDECHEIPALTIVPAEVNLSRMQEKHKSNADTAKLECDRSFKVCKQNCRNHKVTDKSVEVENDMCVNRKSITTSQTEKQAFHNEESKKLKLTSGALALATLGNEAVHAFKEQKSGRGPIYEELDECDYGSSESAKILAGNSLGQDNQHDKHSAQHRRKTRKVRLLTDLLCNNGEAKHDHIITGDSSSNVVNNASTGVGMVSGRHGQASLPENFTGSLIGTMDQTKKRKLSHDVEWKYPETSFFNRISNITSSSKRETETSNAIADSEVNGGMVSGIGVQSGSKSCLNKCIIDKTATFEKKKKRKTQVVDTGLSLVPMGEISSKKLMDNVRNSSESVGRDISLRLEQDASTSGVMDPISLLASRKERKSSSFKKKGKTLQADSGLPSQLPWSGGVPTSLPRQKDNQKVDELMRNNAEITVTVDSSISPKSSPYASLGKWVPAHPTSNLDTYSMPLLNEKQNYNSQDVGNSSKKTTVKECVANNWKHGDQVTNKVSEQGASDDIPMDIVELMAKNQYERCLDNDSDNARLLEMTKEAIEYSKVYDPKEYGILIDKNQKQRPQSRNGITITGKNVVPTKQKAVDYSFHNKRNHNNMTCLGQTQTSSGFSAFSQFQKRPPNRVLVPATGSKCSCAQNCKWNRDMVSPGYPRASTLLRACNTCQSVSRSSEEAARLWSPLTPAQLPIAYIIPKNGGVQPSNSNVLGCGPSLLHKVNVNKDHDSEDLNLNATDIEKHNQTIGAATFSKRNAECLLAGKHNVIEPRQNYTGSLDLCSNETIPAMHLLSLMNARMQSGPSFNMGGNSKFLPRTCPPEQNSNSMLEPGFYKPSNIAKHSSDNFVRVHPSEKSRDCLAVSQTFLPSTSSCQQGFQRATDFSSQLGAMRFSLPAYTRGNLPQNRLEFCGANKTHWLQKRKSETSCCSINRNPADFVAPELGRYMINGEDLKLEKTIKSRKRHGLVDHEKLKRQKNVKCTTEEERA